MSSMNFVWLWYVIVGPSFGAAGVGDAPFWQVILIMGEDIHVWRQWIYGKSTSLTHFVPCQQTLKRSAQPRLSLERSHVAFNIMWASSGRGFLRTVRLTERWLRPLVGMFQETIQMPYVFYNVTFAVAEWHFYHALLAKRVTGLPRLRRREPKAHLLTEECQSITGRVLKPSQIPNPYSTSICDI